MNEKDLNIKYICEKTLLNKDDELVPIILDLIQESYKAGLCQAEIDNTMNLIEENQELKKQLEENQNPLKGIFAQVNDDTLLRDCGNMNAEINELKNQQKEFINYLEEEIKIGTFLQPALKMILQKYKEIIGVSDEFKR